MPNAAQDPRLQAIMNNVTASEAYLAHYKTVTAPLLLQLANATGLPEQEVFVPAIKVSDEGGGGRGRADTHTPAAAQLQDPPPLTTTGCI